MLDSSETVFDPRLGGRANLGTKYRDAVTGRFVPKPKSKPAPCMGCGIMVGDGYMETKLYQVGSYKICGECLQILNRRGKLWVEPYNQCLFLRPDGRVKKEKQW